jgi:hypothetical protein
MRRPPRVAVIYCSATGNVHRLAHALAEGAEAEAAEVRLRHVEEFASEMLISQNQLLGQASCRSRGRARCDARRSRVGRRRRVRHADPLYQGQRLARYAAVIADGRGDDAFRVRRPRPERFHAAALR